MLTWVWIYADSFNLLDAMRHFCGFAGPPRCATRVALTHVLLRALQMQMRELYDHSEYLLWFSPCFFRSSRRRKLFLDRFLQGESVAESGSTISHYFRTYFSLYVVPRGFKLGLCIDDSTVLYRAVSYLFRWPSFKVTGPAFLLLKADSCKEVLYELM